MSVSYNFFVKILVDDDKVILCEIDRFNDMTMSEKQRLIRKSFPRSVLGLMNLFGFKKRIKYRLEYSYRLLHKQFDSHIYQIADGNDWKKAPFMALWLHEKHKIPYLTVSAGDL